jgi:TPR repeat protein
MAMACSNLGLLLAKGDGVPKSQTAALEKFEKGCAGGVAASCANAGVLLKKTKVARGGRTPTAFFSKACKLGDRQACDELNSL